MNQTSSLKRFLKHPSGMVGAVLLAIVLFVALFAGVLEPEGPWPLVGRPLQWPGQIPAVVLGTVIRGETTHYDLVSEESCRGLMQVSIARTFPIGNAIMTVENEEQAWERVLPEKLDKGGGAVRAALIVLANRRKLERGLI